MALETTCAAFSMESGESLFGTVKPVQVWLLLEFNGRWNSEAFDDSDLPEAVKTRLTTWLVTIPQSRILLIRQKPRLAPEGIQFYVALPRPHDPLLYAFTLKAYEDLLALNIPLLVDDPAVYEVQRQHDPLALVCTHGRRDPCCARLGVPVYERLVEQMGARVWQATHVGAHRFAANVLFFPHGIYYGRVAPDDANNLAVAYRDGQMVPELLRGRSAYDQPVQAAEALLRLETGITDLAAFQLVRNDAAESGVVQFAAANGGALHTVEVAEDPEAAQIMASCGDDTLAPKPQYRLVRHIIEQH